jgi:hypothetical protein
MAELRKSLRKNSLSITDVIRLALTTFDPATVTPDMLKQLQATDRRRRAE